MRIKSLTLDFPNSDDGSMLFYEVGTKPICQSISKPITEIRKAERCGEPLALIPYYEIYTEDGLVAEMHQYGHIVYFEG